MIAISLWEPWATAIARGLKKVETRGWRTNYRGRLAIHAAATRAHADFIHEPGVRAIFASAGITRIEQLAFGCVVATCRLVDCRPTEELFETSLVTRQEFSLGNYDPGRFGWILAEIEPLPKPVPAKGKQGFWDWPG